MSTNDDNTATAIDNGNPPPAPAPEAPTHGLRRSSSKRMVAGVCGGIAERFDIEPNLVRGVFVVLAFLYGLGVALYLVMWAVVPRDDEPATATADEPDDHARRRANWRTIVTLAGAIVIGLIISSVLFGVNYHGPNSHVGNFVGGTWVVLLVVLAALALLRPSRGFSFARLFSGVVIVLLIVVVVSSGIFLAVVAMTGVPMSGGIGTKLYTPTSLRQVQPTYRIAFGSMTLDLRQVPFAHQTRSVTASVAVGSLTVDVPPNVVVDLSAQSGNPRINYPQGYGSFYVAPIGKDPAHLILRAEVGIGELNLVRSQPGVSVP
jgi:phage shock protein PspC (stress-responsive transcriptional regulator)